MRICPYQSGRSPNLCVVSRSMCKIQTLPYHGQRSKGRFLSVKNRDLYFIPEAKQDVAEAFAWYEEQCFGLGLEFWRCLEAAIDSVQSYSLMYPVVMDNYRRALIRRFPYAIFYEIESTRTVIHSVFHSSQDPSKWKARLSNQNN